MDSKNKFKIGEFSRLNRITVKTLRHYEEIGLLKPNEVDCWTGYRHYDVSQFQKLSTILYLKKLHFSLEEIRDMFEDGLEMPSADVVKKKLDSCSQEEKDLKWRRKELENLENNIRRGIKMEKVIIKTLPAVTIASYRKIIKTYAELGALCVNVIGPEMRRCGCTCDTVSYCYTFEHDKEHKDRDIDVEYCEAVDKPFTESGTLKCKAIPEVKTAATIEHRGGYDFQESVTGIMNYIEEHGYRITGYPRFCYIDGAWNKEDEADWLTEIQVPVEMA